MSDQKNKTSSAKPQLPASSKADSGKTKPVKNTLAIISLLLVVIATAFFMYRVEMLVIKNSALEKHLNLISQQNQNHTQQSAQLSEQLTQSKQQLSSMSGHLDFMQKTLNQVPGAHLEDWKLAEVEYLLRLANQRVNLQGEIKGAGALLDAANKILAELDDPSMLVIRETIAKEMLLLGNANEIDVQGIYTQLQALKSLIHQTIQPPKTFLKSNDKDLTTASTDQEQAVQTTLINQLLSLVSVRSREAAFDAPLTTEQYQLLEHSLRLMLEQAQWALLKTDQHLYTASLTNAQAWIENKLRHQQAENMVNAIKQLKALTIRTELPDISTSLRLLRQLMQDRTYQPSPIETAPEATKQSNHNKTDTKAKTAPKEKINVKQEQA